MAKRSPKGIYLVSGHAHRELIPARTPGGAVRKFCRLWGISPRTDGETGGWKDISVAYQPFRRSSADSNA